MKRCKICVNSTTRPNSYFDENGICGVCINTEKNRQGYIDWESRNREIMEIASWGHTNSKNSYDCIVTVSGGKDSTRQAFFVRDELKLNPLLVSAVYPPEQMHERGAENLENLISHGFDTISVSLNPQIYKSLMHECLYRFSNIFNASEMALYAIPIHVAIANHIPLIFLGDNPAQTVGEKHGSEDSDASNMRKSNTIMGGKADIFLNIDVTKQDLHFYNYPPADEIEAANIRIIYLGHYIRDWSAFGNGEFSIKRGLKNRKDPPEYTGDLWGVTGLDEDFRLVNQQIKYAKFGIGYVTDQVMDRIHAGKMDREVGMRLIKEYDGKCHPKYIRKLCNYLKISEKEFIKIVEKARNREIWNKDDCGNWILKDN